MEQQLFGSCAAVGEGARKETRHPEIMILRSSLLNEKGRYLSMMLPSCIYRDFNAYI